MREIPVGQGYVRILGNSIMSETQAPVESAVGRTGGSVSENLPVQKSCLDLAAGKLVLLAHRRSETQNVDCDVR